MAENLDIQFQNFRLDFNEFKEFVETLLKE